MKSYLYAAARNRALNHIKRRQVSQRWWEREAQEGGALDDDQTSDPAAVSELQEAVDAAIARLPERTRLVFTMSRTGGLTYPEISEALGISVKTVEAQMSRALRKLRDSLAPFLQDYQDGGT